MSLFVGDLQYAHCNPLWVIRLRKLCRMLTGVDGHRAQSIVVGEKSRAGKLVW